MKFYKNWEDTHRKNWLESASKDEILDYIDHKDKMINNPGFQLLIFAVLIVFVLSLVFTIIYFTEVEPRMERMYAAINLMGEDICEEYGGFVKSTYKQDKFMFQCAEKTLIYGGLQ